MSHVTLTELRQNIASYFDEVAENREPLVVTRSGGKGNVVVMSEAEFAGWRETVHLLSSPRNAARLMGSVRQAKAGRSQEKGLVVPRKRAD
jgi:antitoxin YefM